MSTTTKTGRPSAPSPHQLEFLAHWQAIALERMPYFANIVYALRPLNAPGLRTFAVDEGLRLYVDFDAVVNDMGWTAEQCAQALLHECSHVWREHLRRGREAGVNGREQQVANIASDAEINDDLVRVGCTWLGEFGVVPSKIGQPDDETFEFYLATLREHVKNMPTCGTCGRPDTGDDQGKSDDQQGDQSGQGEDQQDGDSEQSSEGDGSGQDGQGQSGDQQGDGSGHAPGGTVECPDCGGEAVYAGCGSIGGGEAAPCELPSGDDADGAAPAASEVEKDNVLTRTANDIVEAAKNRGNVPGSFVDQARQVLAPPQVPWQRLLFVAARRATTKALGRRKSTYVKRSRRRHNARMGGTGERLVYPGRYTPKVRLLFARDTSGSMSSADLNAIGNEVVGIAKSMHIKGDYLQVMDVDAVVHTVKPYQDARTLTDVSGRGGTDMCAAIAAAAELDTKPDVMVVGTDGYTPWPDVSPGFPVIACVVGPTREEAERVADHCPAWMVAVAIGQDSLGEGKAAA